MLFRSNDTATTEIYTGIHTLSLHDALLISVLAERAKAQAAGADGIVMKPLDNSKLKAALAGIRAARGHHKRPRAVTA